jgi:uncharacterized protein YuzE
MAPVNVLDYLQVLPMVKHAPHQTIWLSYDPEANVLYVNFQKPSVATESELTDDDIIIRYADEEIIGFTILHVSMRSVNMGAIQAKHSLEW